LKLIKISKIDNFHYISFISIILTSLIVYYDLIPQKIVFSFKDISIGLNILALLFSIFFARSKVFVLLFIPLFFSYYMFYPHILGLDGGEYSFWYIYPILSALGFLFIGILQERGLFCFYGLSKVLIIFALLAITYYFLNTFSLELRNALDTSIINYEVSKLIRVNDFTLLISLLSIIFVTVISSLFFLNSIEKAPFWMLYALIIPSLFAQTQTSYILFSALCSVLAIVALLKDAYHMAYIDTLTKIPARRALEETFLKLGATYTIAMVDIDLFKKFNDKYGHDIGDDVLNLVAQELNAVKGAGEVFRYGGEEFTIIFANKTHNQVLKYLEEVRISIEKRPFIIRGKDRPTNPPEKKPKAKNYKSVHVTVSMGLASAPKDGKLPKEIIKKADIALYQAKKAGRNCIITC
jgi:diguanylate cyclase (GGDEF)-like protein